MARKKLIILPKLCDCKGDHSKQWFVYYSCRDPKSGKMHRFRHYDGFTDLSVTEKYNHAQKIIDYYSARLRTGWTPFIDYTETIYDDHLDYKSVAEIYGSKRTGNRTVRFAMSEFLKYLKPTVSDSTYQTYQSKLRILNLWTEKQGVSENDITVFENKLLSQFFRFLIDTRKLSAKTILKYRELIYNLFEFCRSQQLILVNPVHDMPLCNRINDQAPRPIQRADIETFKKELIKDPDLWLAVQFEFYCGLRPGHEIREMKIKNIDFVAGTIRIDRAHAKNRKERVVTIPRQLLLQLRQFYHLHEYDREYYVLGRGGIPGPKCLGKNTLGYRFRKIRKRLKMPVEYKFYSWKHTAAVETDESNISIEDISRHFGHSSISITNEYLKNKRVGVSKAIRDNYPDL